jgi:Flp pilus assembly pilin Flp
VDKQAVAALERGLTAALIAVVAIGACQPLDTNLSATMNPVTQSLGSSSLQPSRPRPAGGCGMVRRRCESSSENKMLTEPDEVG